MYESKEDKTVSSADSSVPEANQIKEPLVPKVQVENRPILKKMNSHYDEKKRCETERNSYTERKGLGSDCPDSPTTTYERRLFSKRSFDMRAHQNLLHLSGKTAKDSIHNGPNSINSQPLDKKQESQFQIKKDQTKPVRTICCCRF